VEEGLGLAWARSNGSGGSRAWAGFCARKKEALTSGPGRLIRLKRIYNF
jgi:hypothetical protein